MEEKENIKSELEEIQTARDNIKAALQNEGETVTNDIRTYANAIPNVNKVKTVNGVEADTNKNVQIDASNINIDETAEIKKTVKEAIEGFDNNKISKSVFTGFKTLYGNRYSVEGAFTHVHANLAAAPRYNSHLNLDFCGIKPATNEASYENFQITSYNKIVDYEGSAHGIIFEVDPSSDSKVNINVDAETADFDPQESGMTSTKIAPAIRELKEDIDAITIPEYSVIETTVTEGYSKTYSLTKDGTEVGVKINIPKDLVVNKGSVKVVATANTPYGGAVVGDKYLDIELNDPTKDHIYIPVKELVDVYIGKNNNKTHVIIGSDNSIEVQIQSGSIEKTDLKQELQDEITNTPSLIYTDSIPVNTTIQTDLGKYQEMYDTFKSGKDVIFIGSMGGIYQVFLLKKNAPITNNTVVAYSTVNFGESNTNSYSQLNNESYSLVMTISNDTVTSVLVSLAVTKKLNSIDPTKTYTTPFIPTNPGHPATKKYVDDNIITYTAGNGIEIGEGNVVNAYTDIKCFDSNDTNLSNDLFELFTTNINENADAGLVLIFYIDGYKFIIHGNEFNTVNISYCNIVSNIRFDNRTYLTISPEYITGNSNDLIVSYIDPIETILNVSGITSTNRYVELPYTSTNIDVYLNGEKLICKKSDSSTETTELKNSCSCYTYNNSGTTKLYFTSDYVIESTDKLVVRQYGVSENYVKG